MALKRVLVGERAQLSGAQVRKEIRKARTLKGFRMKPGFIYTVVRAISARINQNYDGWPPEELKKSYHTFIGKPVFVNHENYDPALARGVVVAARYVDANPNDQYIEVIQEIDAKRFPKLAHEIKTGGLDSVSMGAEAAFTICSYCQHKATDETDMCDHVMFHKGEHLRKFNRRTGKVDDILVYEKCMKLSFFELSYVFDPADETAVASKVLVASAKQGKSSCPPGAICDHPEELGSTKGDFSAAGEATGTPASATSTSSSPSGGGGPTTTNEEGLQPGAANLNSILKDMYPGATIGGVREDSMPYHPEGRALDFMTTDADQAQTVIDTAFKNGAEHVIWNNQIIYNGGRAEPYSGDNPHTDHVHINYASGYTPPAASKDIVTASFERKVLRTAGYEDLDEFPDALAGYQHHRDNLYGGVDSYDSMQHYVDQANNTHGGFGGATEDKLWDYVKHRMDVPGFGPYGRDTQHPQGPYPKDVPTEKYVPHPSMAPNLRLNSFEAAVFKAAGYKDAGATDDYLEWQRAVEAGEITPEREHGPARRLGPSPAQQKWLDQTKRRLGFEAAVFKAAGYKVAKPVFDPMGSQRTQVANTIATYEKAHGYLDDEGADPNHETLDYGAGLGLSATHPDLRFDTFEPHPKEHYTPTYTDPKDIPEGGYGRIMSLNVLNVVPPNVRDHIVAGIGRALAPGGHAVITTRGRDVLTTKGRPPDPSKGEPDEPMSIVNTDPKTGEEWYQKGFTHNELAQYVVDTLPHGYSVYPVHGLGAAACHVVRDPGPGGNPIQRKPPLAKSAAKTAIYNDIDKFPEDAKHYTLPNGHAIHIFPPTKGVPGIAGVMPDKPGENRYEWVHTHHGQPINGGMADSHQDAANQGKSSYEAERSAGELVEPGWDPDRDPKDPRYDPRFAARTRAAQIFERRVLMSAGYKTAGDLWDQGYRGEPTPRNVDVDPDTGLDLKPGFDETPQWQHRQWMKRNPDAFEEDSPHYNAAYPDDPIDPSYTPRNFGARVLKTAGYKMAGDVVQFPSERRQEQIRQQEGPKRYYVGPKHRTPSGYTWLRDPANDPDDGDELDPDPGEGPSRYSSFEQQVLKLAWGETEAPPEVDTLRPEGSQPEDDNDDYHEYVNPADHEFANNNESPQELLTPNLEEAGNIDREQDQQEQQGMAPGQAPPGAPQAGPPQPQPQMMTLQIPMPPQQGQMPMQAFARRVLATAGYDFGTNVENATLENGRGVSGNSRKPRKGTTMGRTNTLAQRGKVASQGRRQHFAEGPYTDGGPFGRDNDQGEQEEAFVTQVPGSEPVDMPDDDTHNIQNTEENLVARVNKGRQKLLADAKQLAAFQAGKKAGQKGRRRTAESISMERAEQVEPGGSTGEAGDELLNAGGFEAVGDSPEDTAPHQASRSLQAFEAFDQWLHRATGRQARHLTEVGIKRAAVEWGKRTRNDPRVLFPALGIVLRQARKNEAAIKAAAAKKKGAGMRRRAVDLEVAAPDGRVDVEAPVENVTDAEAQESQFELTDFADNAGDNVADPDLDTDSQFWAPGEGDKGAEKESRRKKATPKAGGILAVRCAEAYIRAGLEPNTQERKYQLAGLFEGMNRGAVQRDIALLERVAQLQSQQRQKVASGRTRGAGQAIPPGLTQGGTQRSASTRRMSANDPKNDALLFG